MTRQSGMSPPLAAPLLRWSSQARDSGARSKAATSNLLNASPSGASRQHEGNSLSGYAGSLIENQVEGIVQKHGFGWSLSDASGD